MASPRGGFGATASEVDELNRILEVERRLVLSTQQNYRVLKEQHLQLTTELEAVIKERDQLRQEIAESKERFERGLQNIQTKSGAVIEALEKDRLDRENRFEVFKAETLAELQRVYRKELNEQAAETEREKAEREEVVAENDRLLAEIHQLKEERREAERARRREERNLREKFDSEMAALLDRLDEAQEAATQRSTEALTNLRQQLVAMEERLRMAEEDKLILAAERQSAIGKLAAQLEELKATNAEHIQESNRLRAERDVLRSSLQHHGDTIQRLNRELSDSSRARLDSESSSTLRESKLLDDFAATTVNFEEKLTTLEMEVKSRDKIIAELKSLLHDANSSASLHVSSEEREGLLRIEIKKLEDELAAEKRRFKQFEEKKKRSEDIFKEERDRNEQRLAEAKKQLVTTPETAAEVRRLQDELAKKEASIKQMREHYRGLLKQMKHSLVNLEKRHRKTQEKLQTHILV